MSADLSDMAGDIGFRVRSARAVVCQIDEVIPLVHGEQHEKRNEAAYLLAAVVDLLDMVAHSAEALEEALRANQSIARRAA